MQHCVHVTKFTISFQWSQSNWRWFKLTVQYWKG